MKFTWIVAVALAAAAPAAFADAHLGSGDPAAGEAAFNQCATCHVVENEAGEVLAGRAAKTGPNLYGVIGRTAGTLDGFRYQKGIVDAGEKGLVWDAAQITAYLQDPTAFLREFTGDNRARSGMAFKVRSEEEAANLAAFIASLGPVPTN